MAARSARSARRVRFLLSGVLVLAVLSGGGFYLARSLFPAGQASGRAAVSLRDTVAGCGAGVVSPCAGDPAGIDVAASPVLVTIPPRQAGASPSASAVSRSPHPAATATGTASAQPSGRRPGQSVGNQSVCRQPARGSGRHGRRAGARAD